MLIEFSFNVFLPCRCGIVLDPWYLPLSTKEEFFDAGIKKPTFTIFTELFNWHKNVQRSERFNEGLPEGECYKFSRNKIYMNVIMLGHKLIASFKYTEL